VAGAAKQVHAALAVSFTPRVSRKDILNAAAFRSTSLEHSTPVFVNRDLAGAKAEPL